MCRDVIRSRSSEYECDFVGFWLKRVFLLSMGHSMTKLGVTSVTAQRKSWLRRLVNEQRRNLLVAAKVGERPIKCYNIARHYIDAFLCE